MRASGISPNWLPLPKSSDVTECGTSASGRVASIRLPVRGIYRFRCRRHFKSPPSGLRGHRGRHRFRVGRDPGAGVVPNLREADDCLHYDHSFDASTDSQSHIEIKVRRWHPVLGTTLFPGSPTRTCRRGGLTLNRDFHLGSRGLKSIHPATLRRAGPGNLSLQALRSTSQKQPTVPFISNSQPTNVALTKQYNASDTPLDMNARREYADAERKDQKQGWSETTPLPSTPFQSTATGSGDWPALGGQCEGSFQARKPDSTLAVIAGGHPRVASRFRNPPRRAGSLAVRPSTPPSLFRAQPGSGRQDCAVSVARTSKHPLPDGWRAGAASPSE